jgi:hypothetical protein
MQSSSGCFLAGAIIAAVAPAFASPILEFPITGTTDVLANLIEATITGPMLESSARAETSGTIGIGSCTPGGECDVSFTLVLGAPEGNTGTYVNSHLGPLTADFTILSLQFSGTTTAPASSGVFTSPVTVTGALQGFQSTPAQPVYVLTINGTGTLSAEAAVEGDKAVLRSGTYTFSGTASQGPVAIPEPATLLTVAAALGLLFYGKRQAT